MSFSLAHGLSVQLQVVRALVLRETRTRFGSHQLGYLWALLEPVLWVATFVALYAVGKRHPPAGMDVVGFLCTGILTYEVFLKTATRVGEAINANRPLLFYPQVKPIDLVFARAVLEISTLVAVFVILALANYALHPELPAPDDIIMVIGAIGLAGALGASLGLVMCMLGVAWNVVERLRAPLMRPLFWLSCLFYTLNDVPKPAREFLLYNPVLHVIELTRDGWFLNYSAPHVSFAYPACWVLALSLAGLLLERHVRRRIELS
jgi:capsular polysaccharide transport system permease protein